MYEDMMNELRKIAAQVDTLETESKKAADNLEKEVQAKFRDKEQHIVEFLLQMAEVVKSAGFPGGAKIDILCCGNHWDGKPNSCGSHCRPIGVRFYRMYCADIPLEIWFGRDFPAVSCIDKILCVKSNRLTVAPSSGLSSVSSIAKDLRENILTRWNEETERSIANHVLTACKKQLALRTKAATDKLGAANDRYNKFCGGANA